MNSGSATKRAALLAFAFAVTAFSFTIAKADTIFDVEHARADARAGPVNSNDLEYLERWGGTSGDYYSRRRYRRAHHRRLYQERRDWRYR
jgi:hypothetical protein